MAGSKSSSRSAPNQDHAAHHFSSFTANEAAKLAGNYPAFSFTEQPSEKSHCCDGFSPSLTWILSTSAPYNIICDRKYFTSNVRNCSVYLEQGIGDVVEATHVGTVQLLPDLVLHDVIYVPTFFVNLLSLVKLNRAVPCEVSMGGGRCVIKSSNPHRVIGEGKMVNRLYQFCWGKPEVDDGKFWHMRLGHVSPDIMSGLQAVIPSLAGVELHKECNMCCLKPGKDVSPFVNRIVAKRVFELIHCGVRGPYIMPSSTGSLYFFIIVDDFSRHVWACLMKDTSEVEKHLRSFCAMTEAEFGSRVMMVVSDNSAEFYFEEFYREKGMSMMYMPREHCVVEHKQRDAFDVALAISMHAKLPIVFQGDTILAAIHLMNRIPSPLLKNKTPFELLHSVPPSYEGLKVIGCLCCAVNPDKRDVGVLRCLFLGYAKKGYKVYDLSSGTPFVSGDVVFHENVFPFALKSTQG